MPGVVLAVIRHCLHCFLRGSCLCNADVCEFLQQQRKEDVKVCLQSDLSARRMYGAIGDEEPNVHGRVRWGRPVFLLSVSAACLALVLLATAGHREAVRRNGGSGGTTEDVVSRLLLMKLKREGEIHQDLVATRLAEADMQVRLQH